jgi:hypothetical protein
MLHSASESEFFPKVFQRNRCVLAGKLSQEAQEIGIIFEQFHLDFEVTQLRNGEGRTVRLAQDNNSILRQPDHLFERRVLLGQVDYRHNWTSLSPMRNAPCSL